MKGAEMRRSIQCLTTVVGIAAVGLPAQASIISSSVSLSRQIIQDTPFIQVTAVDSGRTTASIDLQGPSNSRFTSSVEFDKLTPNAANVDFNISMDGGDITVGQMIGIPFRPNAASFIYSAKADTSVRFSWDFAYSGPNPFGLQVIHIEENGTQLAELGNFGIVGRHVGSKTLNLAGGRDYTFDVSFESNAGGDLSRIDGNLAGDISFRFKKAHVPEPSALILASLGLFFLGAKRRRALLVGHS